MPFLEATRRPMLHRILLVALTAGVSCWGDEDEPAGTWRACSTTEPCPDGLECIAHGEYRGTRCEIPCADARDCPNRDCWFPPISWCDDDGFCDFGGCL